ncbi:hypothetical protein ACJ9N4_02650 [Enterobacter sp. LM3]|jgi:hypothetical protein|uniref:hypothetical protein n=1 Tax=Enterobacter sp. LM3 TaxID=3384450 RepID=UPI0015DBF981|nr:hypothetical protein WP5S18E01_17720 [Enterobacter cloacae]
MHIGQALDLVSRYDPLRNPLTSLGDYLDPELISRCLAESAELLRIMRNGHENADDPAGSVTSLYP